MTVELGKQFVGLTEDRYSLLVEEVDIVVYNYWRLDFEISVSFSSAPYPQWRPWLGGPQHRML
ncbi:hypothetical protein F5B20DRAFT_562261 [Whalleya microplaca]|nr:hypothetical protein F5B20DRAFT_562261 [Whalleya microplaca]